MNCKIKQRFLYLLMQCLTLTAGLSVLLCSGLRKPDSGLTEPIFQGQKRNSSWMSVWHFFFFFFSLQTAQDTVTQTRNKSGLKWSDFKAVASSSLSGAGCSSACDKETKDRFTPTTLHFIAIKRNDKWKSLYKLVVASLYGCFSKWDLWVLIMTSQRSNKLKTCACFKSVFSMMQCRWTHLLLLEYFKCSTFTFFGCVICQWPTSYN